MFQSRASQVIDPPPLPVWQNLQYNQRTAEKWDFSGATEIQGPARGLVPPNRWRQ